MEHFAGRVCYAVAGFVDKNTDALTVDCEPALAHSKHALVAATFARPPNRVAPVLAVAAAAVLVAAAAAAATQG